MLTEDKIIFCPHLFSSFLLLHFCRIFWIVSNECVFVWPRVLFIINPKSKFSTNIKNWGVYKTEFAFQDLIDDNHPTMLINILSFVIYFIFLSYYVQTHQNPSFFYKLSVCAKIKKFLCVLNSRTTQQRMISLISSSLKRHCINNKIRHAISLNHVENPYMHWLPQWIPSISPIYLKGIFGHMRECL